LNKKSAFLILNCPSHPYQLIILFILPFNDAKPVQLEKHCQTNKYLWEKIETRVSIRLFVIYKSSKLQKWLPRPAKGILASHINLSDVISKFYTAIMLVTDGMKLKRNNIMPPLVAW